MKVHVYKIDGSKRGDVELPAVFGEEFRPDLIRKAVSVAQANRRQPYGAAPLAGRRHSIEGWGPGRGVSRISRLRGGSSAAGVPSTVGGPRAHPPKAEKDWSEKVNTKERRKALRSALAATSKMDIVKARGHKFRDGVTLPIVVEDSFEGLDETKKLVESLEKLGLADDLARARSRRKLRPGVGKLRGRPYKVPRSVLVVTGEAKPVHRAASNVTGVDYASVKELSTEKLAPGGDAGRLTVFTESAIKAIGAWSP